LHRLDVAYFRLTLGVPVKLPESQADGYSDPYYYQ
jgi:hypothetical protein